MKIKLFLILALLGFSLKAATLRTNVTLVWNYPEAELSTNLVFKLYSSPNPATPLASWALLVTVPGTNTQATVPMQPTNMFFVLTASNYWGESDFSNVASTPVPPRSGTLQIQ
jgi:hypothetical protein